MNNTHLQRLEYGKIKEALESHAASYLGRQHIADMKPLTNLKVIRQQLDETAEAKFMLQSGASVPIPSLEGIDHILSLLDTGYVYSEQDFMHMHQFLHSCAQLMKYMRAKAAIAPHVSAYAMAMFELTALKSEIERCIHHGRVTDYASKDLMKVRKRIAAMEERLKGRLAALMSRYSSILQERIFSMRNERYVLPIRKEHRKQVKGTVLDESASGQTVYIEPADIMHLQQELAAYRAEEARIEAKVLSELTAYAEQYAHEIRINVDTVGAYDYLFAKAKYAISIQGSNVQLNEAGRLLLKEARHPLLGSMVPLQFAIGDTYQSLIITGPNTGGKTLALKTVGLLTVMVQSGLLVPVAEGSMFAVFDHIAVDMGDGQSIEHALSTFSAHIRNVIDILQVANHATLVLIDEMASGTDPGEGVGLSIAILEELHRRGATVVATTHFTEIKNFAGTTPGFENARMAFDPDTLQPAYRLVIGEAGQSYAFLIALKLGLPVSIINRSRELTSAESKAIGAAQETGVEATAEDHPDVHEIHVVQDMKQEIQVIHKNLESHEKLEAAISDAVSKPEREATKTPAGSKHIQASNKLQQKQEKQAQMQKEVRYQLGDSVRIPYLGRTGIVCEMEDSKGIVGVLIMKQKCKINKKRLELHVEAKDLYPDNYDLSIVLDTKENRKKRKLMSRKHVEGLMIEIQAED
ncbi:DNA mismatch repair protein MutS [Paenibacillus sp. UMB4589-SE434]|uniref:endonuclease MutS2 n=1 Tax=Paenibacillus sp. UMB4589-SE434 TaxID=3046314 RepID=UPI00254A3EEF|nr:DNA mismatch repair protein MutS [Paenibacillus sp. UMB4589-SE434]MDK8182606.1 DNA mismatch repair protein MutS [Paenibacillus sp. UMB4589-SE434]